MVKNGVRASSVREDTSQCAATPVSVPSAVDRGNDVGLDEWPFMDLLTELISLDRGWVLVGVAVWMIYTGRLVPTRFYERLVRDWPPKRGKGSK